MCSNKISAIIFDLDGTLLDTEEISTQATELALAPFTNRKIVWEIKQQILGLRSDAWCSILIEKFNLHDSLSPNQLATEWERNMGTL